MTQWWRARSTASSFNLSLWWTSLLCVSAFCLRFSAWTSNVQLVLSLNSLHKRPFCALRQLPWTQTTSQEAGRDCSWFKTLYFNRLRPVWPLCLLKVCFVIDCERNWNDHYTSITLYTKSLSWDQHYETFTTKLKDPCQERCCFAASLL